MEKKSAGINGKIQTDAEKPESIPRYTYENEMMRQEVHFKRVCTALVVSIIVNILIVVGFLLYLNQYDFQSYEQDGSGVNIIGNLNGVDYNGTASESAPQEEQVNGQGSSNP